MESLRNHFALRHGRAHDSLADFKIDPVLRCPQDRKSYIYRLASHVLFRLPPLNLLVEWGQCQGFYRVRP
jgi:hypothetical protein